MSLKKAVAIAAAAGALAAISVPAMALENEFHGAFNLKYYLTNYEQATFGRLDPTNRVNTGFNATENLRTNNYFEQRDRLFYTAKVSDDLKLVTGFEIDSMWGDRAQGGLPDSGNNTNFTTAAFRNSGGAIESDAVNLETKWVYLDFKIPSTPTRVTAGIQAFKDSLKGIFFDFDAAGIMASTKLNPLTLNLGYIRGYDQSMFAVGTSAQPKGVMNLDIGLVEAKIAITKDINAGLLYYIYADGRPTIYSPTGNALGTTAPTTN